MKILTLVICCLATFPAAAQSGLISDFIDRHGQGAGTNRISLQGDLFRLTRQEGENDLLLRVERLRWLNTDHHDGPAPSQTRELVRNLRKERFEPLIEWKEEGEHARLLIRENGPEITDVLLLYRQPENFILLHLQGRFRYSDLRQLDLDLQGSDLLEKLPDQRSAIPRA